ncbi:hypothetical protein LPJ61_001574 [Coemansia biformis]|uniref:Fungal lipase-type domain-containing protein n=1 Tax=Coemansia biformis TaxID=1286918 RepID=A0A9W7YHF5_9FUNG|nr:hypothetical protein LPJ61_001574 [Coemansia biformis]
MKHTQMADTIVAATTSFDSSGLETSLPDLTIGVKDGNIMYTCPDQIINRKRCKCYERRAGRYYEEAAMFMKSRIHEIMPSTSMYRSLLWLLLSVLGIVTAQDLDVTPGKTYSGDEAKPYLDIMQKYMSPASDGYIAINTADKELYVVWAGTRRIRSIVVDAMVVFKDFATDVPDTAVHAGFYESTNAAYPHIIKNIRAAATDYPDYNIVFVGHSLGGASAVISALKFASDSAENKDRIRVWTFGQPRTGNRRFAEHYTQVLGNQTYRITYQADIVPHVPSWQVLGYQHHPLEIHIINKTGDFYVCQNTVREDLDGAYRWPTIDTGVVDHIEYFAMPDITRFSRLIEW